MSKRARGNTKRSREVEFLQHALEANGHAILEGPKRKSWNIRDLKTTKPKNSAQEELFHAWYNGKHIVAHGSAGTGKTFLAFYLALQEVLEQRARRIIIVRSAVATREVGFLPGTLEEKTAMYELPYKDIAWELVGRRSTYDDMKEAGLIEFMTTSFVRGLTWDNAIILVDEGQNMTFHEINSIMTRIGNNTRIIFTGDTKQTDLDGKRLGFEGMTHALKVMKGMNNFQGIEFTKFDIVRSEFVKEWITACEEKPMGT